jgi:hypothetical protein
VLIVQLTGPGVTGSATARFRVFPPLHLAVQVHPLHQSGSMALAVRVEAARPGVVTVRVTVPGHPVRQVAAHGNVDARHPLTLDLPLGRLHGRVLVEAKVQVTTREGVIETRSLAVTVQS